MTLFRSSALLPLALVVGCARNPVTGQPQLALVSQSQEIAMGKEASAQVIDEIGLYDDKRLSDLVSKVGMQMAKSAPRPDVPWSFHVLDDPAVNAFALPGGPVFITRGILTHMTNQAELASVLGHECGHIAARHSVEQISRSELAQLGLGVGSVFVPGVSSFGNLLGQGVQVLFLKYSRDDERQADELGFRFAYANGYDVREMVDLFQMLGQVEKQGGSNVPEWLATHPSPEHRIESIQQMIASVGNVDWSSKVVAHDDYLRAIDGVVYGEDKQQGYVTGTTFVQPALKFRIDFPDRWSIQNQAKIVGAVDPEKSAAVEVGVVPLAPDAAMQKFFSASDVKPNSPGQSAPSGARYFEAQAQNGSVQGFVAFPVVSGHTLQYVAYAAPEKLGSYDPTFRKTLSTLTVVTDPKLLAVKVARVAVTAVPTKMTLEQFNTKHPSIVSLDELAYLNGVPKDQVLSSGQLVKRIVGSAE